MRIETKWVVSGVIAAGLAIGGAGIATGAIGDDSDDATDVPITGEELERASAAALAHTGGGTVTDTEIGDEEGYYEVEVTRADGRQVDVHLDRDFQVVGEEADEPGDED